MKKKSPPAHFTLALPHAQLLLGRLQVAAHVQQHVLDLGRFLHPQAFQLVPVVLHLRLLLINIINNYSQNTRLRRDFSHPWGSGAFGAQLGNRRLRWR